MGRRNPIVCTLTASEREARGDQWRQLIARWSGRVTVAKSRVTLRFDDAGVRTELEELVAQERRCCKWMELDVHQDGQELVLTVGAEDGAGAAAIGNMMAFGADPVSNDPAP